VLDNEPPRTGWVEILMLAERLQPHPALVPRDERQRAQMFGLANELCGEDGYGWNRRLMFFANWRNALDADNAAMRPEAYHRMSNKYGYGGDVEHARARIVAILELLSEQLLAQRDRGSRYYVGDQLSAVDIYAACFMAMVRPLPIELCATSPEMHAAYAEYDPAILAAADPILLAHRDFMYATHLETPLRL
jgi:glutathione S-transferase